jgi:flagellar biogenesis protein FliO
MALVTRSLLHFVPALAVLWGLLVAPVHATASPSPPDLATPATIATGEHTKKLGLPKPPSSATPGAAPAPDASKADDSSWVYRTVASLAGVIVLIVAVSFVVQRVARQQGGLIASLGPGGRAPSGLLEVLGRYPISRGTTLVLLKVDRRVLLLCQTSAKRFASGTSMSTLCEITDPDDVASILVKARDEEGDTLARKFESMLGSFAGKHATAATVEPKPAGGPRAAAGLADLLRGNTPKKAAAKPTTPAKPLTKAQAIAALESRLQALRAQGAKEKAA